MSPKIVKPCLDPLWKSIINKWLIAVVPEGLPPLHPWREYTEGPKLTFFRPAPSEIYFQSPDGKCGRQIRSIKFFLLSETQQRESFQDVSSQENIPLLNDRKSQIPRV